MTHQQPESNTVNLGIWCGKGQGCIVDMLETGIRDNTFGQPMALWVEPATGDPSNFEKFAKPGQQPFVGFAPGESLTALIAQTREAQISECRIFYPQAVLHLVSEGTEWRSVFVSEINTPPPDWLKNMTDPVADTIKLLLTTEPIMIMRSASPNKKWKLVKYQHPETCLTLFWRIIHE